MAEDVMSTPSSVIVWLDPGKLTGWAMLENLGTTFRSGQADFDGIDELVNTWSAIMGPRLWLGWEMYIVTQGGGKSGTPSHSLEVIGAVKSACRRHHVTVLSPMPSAARNLGDDRKLQALGWRKPGKRHANDAANHLLSFLIRERMLSDELIRRAMGLGEQEM